MTRRFIDSLSQYIPRAWLGNRPQFQSGFKSLWLAALFCDVGMQAWTEGLRAAWPGSDSRTDNLDALSYSRGLVQGETESVSAYQGRLRAWMTTWQTAGSDLSLAMRLQEYIAGNPQVRVIRRNGIFTTVAASGTVSRVQGTWNWDGTSNPERSGNWWDCWIVVYPLNNGFYIEDTGVWGDSGQASLPPDTVAASYSTMGFGHSCTRAEVDTIRGLVKTWKGAHVNVRAIIWSYGTDYYAPTPVTGSPDGTWGKWFVQSTNLASRNKTDRFWSLGTDTNS